MIVFLDFISFNKVKTCRTVASSRSLDGSSISKIFLLVNKALA